MFLFSRSFRNGYAQSKFPVATFMSTLERIGICVGVPSDAIFLTVNTHCRRLVQQALTDLLEGTSLTDKL